MPDKDKVKKDVSFADEAAQLFRELKDYLDTRTVPLDSTRVKEVLARLPTFFETVGSALRAAVEIPEVDGDEETVLTLSVEEYLQLQTDAELSQMEADDLDTALQQAEGRLEAAVRECKRLALDNRVLVAQAASVSASDGQLHKELVEMLLECNQSREASTEWEQQYNSAQQELDRLQQTISGIEEQATVALKSSPGNSKQTENQLRSSLQRVRDRLRSLTNST